MRVGEVKIRRDIKIFFIMETGFDE